MTLNLRIFKLIGGLVTASSLAILVTVWLTGINQISNQISKDLTIGQSVVERVFSNRSSLLYNTADVLTADFGFKQAVASKDQFTIESALLNHGQRISADLMMLLSLDGQILASTIDSISVGASFKSTKLVEEAISGGGLITLLSLNGKLYQIILLTVDAPTTVAIAGVGFEISTSFVKDLSNITKLHVSILDADHDKPVIPVSSLSDELAEEAINSKFDASQKITPFNYDGLKFVSHHFSMNELSNSWTKVDIVLSERLSFWFGQFYQLLLDIMLIGSLSMALAILLGLIFSRNITQPLANLVGFARNISSGRYQHKEVLNNQTKTEEIKRLEDAFFTMQDDIQKRQEKIEYQAKYDLVTALFNRYEITHVMSAKLDNHEEFQVISFKIVGFREVNNAFGYDCGDACMASLAKRIEQLKGLGARLNGSEILWLPESVKEKSDILKMRDKLEEAHRVNGLEINLKLSISIIHVPEHAGTVEQIFRYLSIAGQKAEDSVDLFMCYQAGMEADYLKRLAILRELELALDRSGSDPAFSELTMVYQPKLNVRINKITKVEALIRWNSNVLGFVPPDLFIPIAEKAGLINELTRWVIKRVVKDLVSWREYGLQVSAAVNLSVHDLTDAPLIGYISDLMHKENIDSDMLEFEVTESDLMNDPKKAIDQLHILRNMGFSMAIDDFGTGYSSMAYLKTLPVSALKVDKSFVLNLHENQDDQTIVQTMIDLAKRFDLEVVAEGVENQASLTLLEAWGCDWIQGYYISKPVNSQTLIEVINHYHAN